jgi:hypothetical protein
MRPAFTDKPLAENMVTEPTDTVLAYASAHKKCTELLCVECGWQGHAHFPDAPWPVFQTHKCKLRTQSISTL